MEAEDVDPAFCRARNEPAREIASDGARADEEAAAERHAERRLRPRLERPDPFPWALDPAAYRAVEDASTGNLERGEPDPVEELCELQQLGGRHAPGQRLLAEQADGRVDELRHVERVTLSLGSRRYPSGDESPAGPLRREVRQTPSRERA